MESKKIDEFSIEITKESPQPSPVTNTYERAFIESQIVSITTQRDAMIALKEAELKECQDILAEMNKKGIITQAEFRANIINEEIIK